MNITTQFDVGNWVYGYKNGNTYSGAITKIEVEVNGGAEIKYQIGERTELSAESELAIDKATLISQMQTAEDNANTSRKTTLESQITALADS